MFEMKEWCKQLANAITCNYTDFKNIDGQDLEELGKWIDIKKDLAEMEYYEAEKLKSLSIIEAMDKEGNDSEMMGYNNRRYASGEYAPTGRGGYAGYMPEMPGYMPEMYGYVPEMYGYKQANTNQGNSGNTNSQGKLGYNRNSNRSAYGVAYDKFNQARKYYTETKNPEHHRQMKDSVDEVMNNITDMLADMWKDMDTDQKVRKKEELIDEISRLPSE